MEGMSVRPDPARPRPRAGAWAMVIAEPRRILVVDDEQSITDLVAMALRMHGVVEVAHSGAEALRVVQSFRPHLVILDVMLPDLDGFSPRADGSGPPHGDTPVLFLSARSDLDDRLRGLALGGDDYMTKPFSVEEMLLRINAILRRTRGSGDDGPRVTVGDLQLDEVTHEVKRGPSSSSSRPPSSASSTT